MINEFYPYLNYYNKIEYLFASEGMQGDIYKMVVFTHIRENIWNLGFGDLVNGEIDDTVISNNFDIVKLIGTIAKITYEFSEAFPERQIRIQPVDEKRKKLYNHVFRRHHEVILMTFEVFGYANDRKYLYSPKNFYDIFELKRKFVE